MATISAAAVKALRDKTNLPMMKCKEALAEAGGDEAKAIEILRSQVKGLLEKRGENVTNEGYIQVLVSDDGSKAAMVEIQCESAPVAGSEEFRGLARLIARQLLEGPGANTVDDLMQQPAPEHGDKTLQDVFEELLNKIREKFVVARVKMVEGPVGYYVHHDGKTAAVFQATGEKIDQETMRDVAMHIAAMKPEVVRPEDVDPAKVKAQREELVQEAKATGKPDNIIDKIVDGRMKVFYRDEAGVLMEQPFAKDDSKSVSQVLAEKGMKPKGFTLWVLGQ